MIKKIFVWFAVLNALIIVSFTYATVSCEYKPSCSTGEINLFHVNDNFKDSGRVQTLSSNVALSNYNLAYTNALCCGSDRGDLDYDVVLKDEVCPGNGVDILYYSHDFNSRVGIAPIRFQLQSGLNINPSLQFYTKKLCVSSVDTMSRFHIITSDYDYSKALYTCLFKTSDIENGLVSSCDATFGTGSNQYQYTVWGKVSESAASIECNSDCTSKLDGRVYSTCSEKVAACKDVPLSCDGSLVGSWVPHLISDQEVQCSAPWNNYRSKIFTQDKLKVESVEGQCENLISQKYTVFLNNEPVTMKIYVCSDNS